MIQNEVIRNVASFLFDCIEASKTFSYAIVTHDRSENIFTQFFVVGDQNEKPNGEIQVEIVGVEYAQPICPSDSERFLALIKSGWEEDDGNAQKFVGRLHNLSDVTKLVENTMLSLMAVYQIDSNSEWSIEFNQEAIKN
jgi:hypothetical protein